MDRFSHERHLLAQGFNRVAGIDEAGRGPLAGPVVAAAVVLPTQWVNQGIPADLRKLNDSKQLTASQRDAFFDVLRSCAGVDYGVAIVMEKDIDRLNILNATHFAMVEALGKLNAAADHVLVDGLRVKVLSTLQTPLVKGDSLSFSIAAASVLAKVTRDRIMMEYDRVYPGYGFGANKGYGTASHLAAIRKLGPCPIHRRSFAPVKPPEADLFPGT